MERVVIKSVGRRHGAVGQDRKGPPGVLYWSVSGADLSTRLDEPGDNGPVHWSPYRSGVQQGTLVTDNGFWDTFRTVYPLLALLYPDASSGSAGGG